MELTDDQRKVVELCSGSHLVLAPPGSGKTEMLSQRILRAVKNGVDPARMLCATFTNRAAFEMRDRVKVEGESCPLPDVGNLHHFCHRFLISVGRLPPAMQVLDEGEQLDFVREVVDALRHELASGDAADARRLHGVSVVKVIKGMVDGDGNLKPARVERVRELIDSWFAKCREKGCSPYPEFLTAVLIVRQHRVGIPRRFVSFIPSSMHQLNQEGVIGALEKAYTGLKRKFHAVDFDDLVNETYSFLERRPLADERKYSWVQIDEVQDLSPLQWSIVNHLTSKDAVSVYFGDAEQSIFSFLGASASRFSDAVRGCEKHYLRKNFRATPILLEVLMRYSISTLRSDWTFLPQPSDVNLPNGMIGMSPAVELGTVVSKLVQLLRSGMVDNVALLVRRNVDADQLEDQVRPLGYRYTKVSGIDLFTLKPMRDFLAFVSLFAGTTPRTAWARLLRRVLGPRFSEVSARYFVRGMFTSGFDPRELLEDDSPVPFMPRFGDRRSIWAWRNRRELKAFRETLKSMCQSALEGGDIGFRKCFEVFSAETLRERIKYRLHELWPEKYGTKDDWRTEELKPAVAHVCERMEKFLRYVDHVYDDDRRPFREILLEDWNQLSKLKEADLLVGDEKIVISTVHKAKGRQFDAVVVPNVSMMLGGLPADSDESKRLLYVAMSRAKRHLFLYGCNEDESALVETRECFQRGYAGYFIRKSRGDDLSLDWLASWEELARCRREGEYPEGFVDQMLASNAIPLARMALKVLKHCPDAERRRNKLLSLVRRAILIVASKHAPSANGEGNASLNASLAKLFGMERLNATLLMDGGQEGLNVPVLKIECWDTLVNVIAECGIVDSKTVSMLRVLSLVSSSERAHRAFFEYLASALEYTRSDDGHQRPEMENRQCLQSALGDFIYYPDGNLRFDAAVKLFDLGCHRWLDAVNGVNSDYAQIADIDDSEHEPTIRCLILVSKSKDYQRSLRTIIEKRALRR